MELNVTNTKRKCKLKFELGDKLAAAPPAGGSQSERVSSADIKPHLSGKGSIMSPIVKTCIKRG